MVGKKALNDPRFAHVRRFKRLQKKNDKVEIDERFKAMFTDKRFQTNPIVDKRGRIVDVSGKDQLKRYYGLKKGSDDESEEESESEDEESESENEESAENEESESENEKSESEDEESAENDENEPEADELGNDSTTFKNDWIIEDVNKEEAKDDRIDEEKEKKRKLKEEKRKELNRKKTEKIMKISENEKNLLTPEIVEKLQDDEVDYARGRGRILSESSSEEETTDEEEFDAGWAEFDNDAESIEEPTSRIAICNQDWDQINSQDLMVLFSSFLPAGGIIHSITIYPSDFGLQKMEEENKKGPTELPVVESNDFGDEESKSKKMEDDLKMKIRQYEFNRLRYYYAVMVCDSPETANILYSECDGKEFETSAAKLDLRFIPEDMTFDQKPRDACNCLPDLTTYRPKVFRTKALTHTKPELTWDQTDPNRKELIKNVHTGKVDEKYLKQYVAFSSSSEEEDEDEEEEEESEAEDKKEESEKDVINKYKSLLRGIDMKEKNKKKNQEGNLEVSWDITGNKGRRKPELPKWEKEGKSSFDRDLLRKQEKAPTKAEDRRDKNTMLYKDEDEEAPFSDDEIPFGVDMNNSYFKEELDKFKKKNKTKNFKKNEAENEDIKKKNAELELLLFDGEESKKHFNYDKIVEDENKKSKKKKKDKTDEEQSNGRSFQVDVNDERFSALYTSHHFNIDPTDPHFKNTKGTQAIIAEKLRRRKLGEVAAEEPSKKPKKDAELSMLVKSIKSKTEAKFKKNSRNGEG